jgi:hypothetical protein
MTMKIRELIKELSALDPDMEVIMQKDSEGNGYSPLEGLDPNAVYVAESTWHGDVYDTSWTADDACMDDEEWNEILDMPRSLILFPVN